MQTLSPTISPTITRKVNPNINSKATDAEASLLPAIAHSSVLKTALTGLESSLNDELDRYRHWQANGQTISYLNPFRPRAISTQSVWASPSMSEALLPPLEPPVDKQDQRTGQMSVQMPGQMSVQMPVMPPLGKISTEINTNQGLDKSNNPDNFSNSNTGIDNAFASTQTLNTYAIASDSNAGNVSPDNFSAGTKNSQPDDDEILQNLANDYANHYQNSINQESQIPIPKTSVEKNTFRSLMNPVGIISLLLLLCSSAAIGYLLVDPSGVMKIFKTDNRPKTSQADSKSDELGKNIDLQNQQEQKTSDASLSFVPFASDKNLSNQTFDKLNKNGNSLNPAIAKKNSPTNPLTTGTNLFVPNSNSSSNSSSTPLRTVPPINLSNLAVAPLPPALAPVDSGYTAPERSYEAPVATSSSRRSSRSSASRSTATPRATYTEPANTYTAARSSSPTSSSSISANNVSGSDYVAPRRNNSVKYAAPLSASPMVQPEIAASTNNDSYRVVVENGYGANAQQVERDAYVRPSDGQVQVGSYRDPNAAQQRIEQLRRQGIPAKID